MVPEQIAMWSSSIRRRGLRAVALFEVAKAALVLLVGMGLLSLVHHDVQALAERVVERFHLNPARKYPRIFIAAAGNLTDAHLQMMAALAATYAAMRGVEAFGLWRERRWAEWFALASGCVYFPFELYELDQRFTWVRVSALVVNVAIVAYMAAELHWSRRERIESLAE
jgi:uncharacterized membrane protein (DUF2068 family)